MSLFSFFCEQTKPTSFIIILLPFETFESLCEYLVCIKLYE